MNPLPWVYNDGGRAAAGWKGDADDCVVRAIAIANKRDYNLTYNLMKAANEKYSATHRERVAKTIAKRGTTPRNRNFPNVYKPLLIDLGWEWVPTMSIGSGTTVHLAQGELPEEHVLIVSVSKHLVAVVDGVVHDTHDPTRDGKRAVYGYYRLPTGK